MTGARFSSRSLRTAVRSTDGDDYGVDFTKPIDQYILDAEAVIADPGPALANFNRFKDGARGVVSYSDYPTILSLRVLSTYIRRKYSLQTETRESVSRSIIQALADSSTIRVYRRDIASFYETVPTDSIKEDFLYKDVLSPRARRMLESFFENHCQTDVGLPRGLGLSAVLAEYVMKPVDDDIRLIPGVYRYHRFVDDLVLFATTESRQVPSSLAGALPAPLVLNRSRAKCDNVVFARPKGGTEAFVGFEYLGYSYHVSLNHSAKRPRDLRVGIANSKLNRLKTRLLLAARLLIRDSNINLFIDRVRYLTGNYRFVKRRAIASTGRTVVKSGIFYNYRYCGSYRGSQKTRHDMAELKLLDWFLQKTILGVRHPLGVSVTRTLGAHHTEQVRKLSFAQGHLRAFDCGFDSARVAQIREAWKNV